MCSKKFVRFAWSGNLYKFLRLCFGFGPASRIFSKLFNVPIALLRRLNIGLVIYLEDILLMRRTVEEILMSRETLIFLLQHLGFVINLKKSVLKLSQQIEFLGLKIDTHSMTSALTEEKKEKVILKRQNLLSHPQTTALELTQLIGLMSSTVQADLPVRLQIRHLQQQQIQSLHQAISYQVEIVLNCLSKTGTPLVGGKIRIKQWKITKAKGTKFCDTKRCIKIRLGSLLQRGVNCGEMVPKGGELTYKCSGISSSQVCDSNIHKRTIKYSNSLAVIKQQNCTFISFENGGTHNRELLHISKSIWSYLLSKQIAMPAEYLPCALNVHADWESRNANDNSEWKLDVSVFQEIVTHMGQPTLDLLASRLCHQLPRYIAWKPDQGSIATDAFLHLLDREQFSSSSIQLDKSGSKEDSPRKNRPSNHSDTDMANSALVCTTYKNVCTDIISSASIANFLTNPPGKNYPLVETGSLRLAV